MSQVHRQVHRPINFKEIFSDRIVQTSINPYITLAYFIEILTPQLATWFGINVQDIEIIESGQYRSGSLAEAAPSLIPSDIQLSQKWGENLDSVSFYIRRKNHVYPQLEAHRRFVEDQRNIEANRIPILNSSNVSFDGDCPICWDTSNLTRRYNCNHGICFNCYVRCQTLNIHACSLCRSE